MKKIILICLSIGVLMFGIVGVMSKANAATIVSLPLDFSVTQGTNNIYYEAYPDNRPTNITNYNSSSRYLLTFSGTVDMYNGDVVNSGPTYTGAYWGYPYVLFDPTRNVLLLHPSAGDGNAFGASIQFIAPQSGYYHVSGDFARANNYQYAGNGVDVLIFRGTDPGNALFSASIEETHPVDTNDYLGGSGVAHFDFGVNLAQNEMLRFAVFSDAQSQDGYFDVTALRFAIVPIPATILLLGSGIAGLAGLTIIGRAKDQL